MNVLTSINPGLASQNDAVSKKALRIGMRRGFRMMTAAVLCFFYFAGKLKNMFCENQLHIASGPSVWDLISFAQHAQLFRWRSAWLFNVLRSHEAPTEFALSNSDCNEFRGH